MKLDPENASLGEDFPDGGAWLRRVPLLLALWLTAGQADVFVRDDGTGVSLTNVPVTDGYAVVVTEPPEAIEGLPGDLAAASSSASGAGVADSGGTLTTSAAGKVSPYLGHVKAAAARHGVPEELLHAVIRVESNFNPRAVSPRGARGLMQLMPATARELGVHDPFDPAANIDGGARYLRRLLEAFGHDVRLAVAAYNAGPMAVRRWGGVPRYRETEQYVPRVLGHFHALGGTLRPRGASNWR